MQALLRDFASKTKPYLKSGVAIGLDFLFPPRCMSCSTYVEEAHRLCLDCFSHMQFISDPQCTLCGMPFEYDLGQGAICGACMHDAPRYAAARAVLKYDETCRDLVTRFKYADRLERAPGYANMMHRAGAALIADADMIIPVPLHQKRLQKRKYNQSAVLAYALSDLCDLPVWPDGLLRVKDTEPQASLSRAKRLTNVTTAFRVNHDYSDALRGKTPLLIDDVMTTGATIDACAKMLLGAGAKAVYVLTLARTVRD